MTVQQTMTRLAGLVAIMVVSAVPAFAQQTTVSALAADGYEVMGVTTFDVTANDDRTGESVFLIMQKGTSVYGCALQSANRSFCQLID